MEVLLNLLEKLFVKSREAKMSHLLCRCQWNISLKLQNIFEFLILCDQINFSFICISFSLSFLYLLYDVELILFKYLFLLYYFNFRLEAARKKIQDIQDERRASVVKVKEKPFGLVSNF